MGLVTVIYQVGEEMRGTIYYRVLRQDAWKRVQKEAITLSLRISAILPKIIDENVCSASIMYLLISPELRTLKWRTMP